MRLIHEETGPGAPRRTHLPVYISERDLAHMAEQLGAAIIHGVCDPNELKIAVQGRLADLPEVARKAMEDWLKAEVRVIPVEPDVAPGFHRYRSHKVVEAAEIVEVIVDPEHPAVIGTGKDAVVLVNAAKGVPVESVMFARGMPAPGDFLVRYNAGTPKEYLSWSPRDVFLDGYTRISED